MIALAAVGGCAALDIACVGLRVLGEVSQTPDPNDPNDPNYHPILDPDPFD